MYLLLSKFRAVTTKRTDWDGGGGVMETIPLTVNSQKACGRKGRGACAGCLEAAGKAQVGSQEQLELESGLQASVWHPVCVHALSRTIK